MQIFEAKNYREFVQSELGLKAGRRRRGVVVAAAKAIKCHTSFISQVIHGDADFNSMQAVRFCAYVNLSPEDSDLFVEMVLRDRAPDDKTRAFFQRRIDSQQKSRSD